VIDRTIGRVRHPKTVVSTRDASLEELEVAGAQYAYEEGVGAAEAASRVLERMVPAEDAMRVLVHTGLMRRIQDVLDADQEDALEPDEKKRTARLRARPSRVRTGTVLGDIWLMTGDGYRSLLSFAVDHWRWMMTVKAGIEATAGAQRAAAELALTLLTVEGVEQTADLSDDAKAKLSEAVKAAWGPR
jgi:hypothetical protein